MKKYILSILVSVVITGCFAQVQLRDGKIRGRHDTLNVQHSKYVFNNQKTILISSTKNKYNDGIPYGKNQMELGPKDVRIDQELIKSIIMDVLKDKLQALHRKHEQISGSFVFDLSGNIIDVAFSVRENTVITAEEFEKIDNRLRAELKATFTGKFYLTHVAINGYIKTIDF